MKWRIVFFLLSTGTPLFALWPQAFQRDLTPTKPDQVRCLAGTAFGKFPAGTKVTASSTLREKGRSYAPEKLLDLDYGTSWCEGSKGSGTGEWIRFTFPPASFPCGEMVLFPGVARSISLYEKNNRVKSLEMEIEYGDGTVTERTIEIPDRLCTSLKGYCGMLDREFKTPDYGIEALEMSQCMKKYAGQCVPPILEMPTGPSYPGFQFYDSDLQKPGITSLKFTIRSVYPGSAYDDTCISELFPMGLM